MKKSYLIILLLLIPSLSFANFTVPWQATSTATSWISPKKINGAFQTIVGNNFMATSSGSVSVPSYNFLGSPSTGIYSSAANTISFTTNGTLRTIINSTGQVLSSGTFSAPVGTAGTPSYRVNSNYGMFFDGSYLGFSNAGVEQASLNNGIGLIFGSATSPSLNFLTGVSGASSAGTTGLFYIDPGVTGFSSAGVESMRIISSGNVGIGTSSPWRTLSVNGSSDLGTNALAGSFTSTSTTATSTLVGPLKLGSTGSSATIGNATLITGTVTVTTGAATSGGYVVLTRKTSGGTIGTAITYSITNGSFVITSDNILDTSTFTWLVTQ